MMQKIINVTQNFSTVLNKHIYSSIIAKNLKNYVLAV